MKYYCGIDLGSRNSQICVRDEKQKQLFNLKLHNNPKKIVSLLKPYRENMKAVVESTFNWYWLVDALQEQGFNVRLAHTLGLSYITKAKVKTDKIDARKLAILLSADLIPEAYIYPKQNRYVRDLIRRRIRLVRQRAAEYAALRRCLYQQGLCDHSRNSIKTVNDEDLDVMFKHPVVRFYAGQEVERIRFFSRQLDELERRLLSRAKKRPEFSRLQQVPGIGPILALTILYEIGEIERFRDARTFSSYCRLVPGTADSGERSCRGRASKQGNPNLKWAFTQAAMIAAWSNPKAKRLYEKQQQRHKGKAQKLIALNILAHKLAQAVYHILRDNTTYQEVKIFGK